MHQAHSNGNQKVARICLVGIDNHLMLKPTDDNTPVNGEAVQQVLLARAFRDLGCAVSTVVRSVGREIDEMVDEIRVRSAFRLGAGIPILRFIHPRATGLFRALADVDADIYFQAPAGGLTGLTAAFCRWKGRRFAFRVASDADCIPGRQLIALWRDRKLYEYGLRNADLITVQSRYQQQLLEQHYGLASTVVSMTVEAPQEDLDGERDIDVLWISNLKRIKRPDRVIRLAEKLPDICFTMVGGEVPEEKSYYARVEREAQGLPNLRFLGPLPYRDVNALVARSKILLNTSDVEGFPNTFLQAWVRRVPVVSFFDPDGIIVQAGLGIRPDTEEEMREALSGLMADRAKRERIGAAAEAYATSSFSAAATAKRYLELCEQ